MLAAFEAGATDRMFWAPRHAYGPDQGFLKRYFVGLLAHISNLDLSYPHPRQVCVAMGQVVGSQSRQLHLRPVPPNQTFSDAASRREEQLRGERGGGGRRDEAALPVEMQAKRSQGLALLLNNPESNLDDLK